MDALDIAVLALRIALVLLLYLFLWIVVRMAVRGLTQPVWTAPAPPSQLRLVVVEPGGSGLAPGGVITVSSGATLGRAARSAIVLSDSAVSGEHARVVQHDNRWMVADLGSTNGTLLNDQVVKRQAPLAPGDVLGLGNVRLRVVGTMAASDK